MHLEDLGWRPAFADAFARLAGAGLRPARVVREDKHRYLVHDGEDVSEAVLPGRLQAAAERPVVGDWLAVRAEARGSDVVEAVLPRQSAFSRKQAGDVTREQVVAANIDTVFVVAGLDGDFNLRRLERYLTQAWNSGAVPVLLLNKADVCDDVEGRRVAAEAVAPGVDVHVLSAAEGAGLEALGAYLGCGRTVAFLGSSGVGKSTLVNRLLGEDRLRTTAVREDDSRGRHTTTHRELFVLPGGGAVVDTPGLRELQLWGDEGGLAETFSDVEALAAQCRFRDCAHDAEPGCAVRAAVEAGTLDADRLRSYHKLRRELDYLARRQDEAAAFEQRRHEKALHKMYRRVLRDNPKRR